MRRKQIKNCLVGDYVRFPSGYLHGDYAIREFVEDRVVVERIKAFSTGSYWAVPGSVFVTVLEVER